ncbi:DUF58 domain-containing protein [Vibrio splendidus]|uniref:DUF58 domain-containing protein n=1 Tax=Vibrio splendidus TaxID=29497 RepID=UPI00080E6667|nr:DUF58 domain-containing protein [Vibrio splendidus]OCH67556.1 cytosolic protein [Vibrio splendidus]PTO84195.1 DUF58 domain-containing protein [Vibrio splendidus]PTQ14177.1 DUF58 domain-containing protein [Vibrio splendidus]
MNNQLPNHSDGVTLNLDELLQYKAQSVRWLPPAKSLWSQLNGQHESNRKGRGMNFSEVRQYQAGDDIRSIDWRVTARTGKAHTKLFSEEREQPVILFLDLSSSMIFGSTLLLKSVQLAHFASQLCWLTVAQKDRIGAVIDTGQEIIEIKPSASNHAPLRILQKVIEINNAALTNQDNHSDTTLEHGLKSLHQLCPKGSDIIMLSDFVRYNESNYSLINQIRRHNRVRLVHFYDPLEQGVTAFKGSKQITDGNKTQWFNFSSSKEKEKLSHAFDQKQQQLMQMSLSLAIPYSSLSCAQSLMSQVSGVQS